MTMMIVQRIQSFITSKHASLLWAALLAVALATLGGWLAYSLSREYYSIAPYHFDSAAYRYRAFETYQAIKHSGQWAVAWDMLHDKDSLDLMVRAFFAPQLLTVAHGHLPVLLACLALFLALLIYYIVKHCNSWLLGIGVAMLLFSLPYIFHLFKGIADYWVDNIATWMLGAAALCWMLAENLRHRRWSVACSLLLVGVLVERSVIAVYAAPLFLVMFIVAAIQRVRQDGVMVAIRRIIAFALPALVLGGIITALRWQELYTYYFEWHYDYGTRMDTARRILAQIVNDSGISLPIIAGAALLCVISTWRAGKIWEAPVTAAWLVVALPMEIVLSGQFYHSFYILWSPLLLVLLAVLLSRLPGQPGVPKQLVSASDDSQVSSAAALSGHVPEVITTGRMPTRLSRAHVDFAFADPASAGRLPSLQNGADPIARQVIAAMSRYMRNSRHWKAVSRIESPYGNIYSYCYSALP